jgi:Kef-type K+ transport system membrane component KefB
MRRIIVLALLLAGMSFIKPLGAPGLGSQSLLAFGFLILGAYAAGELAEALSVPKLVGYLLSGVIFGPWGLNTVASDSVVALTPVGTLAIALIAFLAGAELRIEEVRSRGRVIVRVLTVELLVTLTAITLLLIVLRDHIPFLASGTMREVFAFSLLFASIGVVHSPAVAMALLSETGARGPVARTSLGVVLLSDVVIVLLLTATLAVARIVVPPVGVNVPSLSLGGIVWEIAGAALVGAALGAAVALYLRVVRRELFLFAIFVAFFGSEVARLTHVEPLLTLIVAGFVAENVSLPEHGSALRHSMERAAAPVFVVFFALAGAQIVLPDLARLWPLVLPLVLVRGASIWAGVRGGARWSRLEGMEGDMIRRHLWTALIPQAGVAIGLAAAVANTYPVRGGQIRTLFLGLVAVNQMLGPILFRRALQRSGEIQIRPVIAGEAGE